MKDGATLRSSPPWHVRAAETQVRSALSSCGVHGKDKRTPIVYAQRLTFKVLGIGALSASLTASATLPQRRQSDIFQNLRHRYIDSNLWSGR